MRNSWSKWKRIHVKSKRYENQPEAVIEDDSIKIFWYFTVQTDHFITARRPDMIFIDKKTLCQTIDFAIPHDTRVDDKDVEKTEKYLDLAKELKRAWIMKVTVVLLVTGALDTAAEALEKRLNNTGIEKKITELQKAVLKHPSEK